MNGRLSGLVPTNGFFRRCGPSQDVTLVIQQAGGFSWSCRGFIMEGMQCLRRRRIPGICLPQVVRSGCSAVER